MSAAAPAEGGRPGMLEPLRLREFRLLLAGFIVGQSMMPLQFVTAIAWIQVIAEENVVVMVAAISTIRGLGMVGFGLFGGALADRFDRRRLLMATQALAFAANIAIALMMWMGASDIYAVALFFLFTALASAAHAIDGPTRNAIAPEILGPRLTPAGIALNSAAMSLAMPVAIVASGLLIDYLGHGTVYAISSFGHLGEILILAMMSYRTVFSAAHLAARRGGSGQAFRDIAAGLRYTCSQPTILWTVVAVILMMTLIMPPTGSLGPHWVTTVVGATWSQFSFIAVFWGLGAMIASATLVRFSWVERKGLLTGSGVLVMALGFVVFTLMPTALNAILGNYLLGTGMSMAMVSSAAIIAHIAPNEMRGRVMGLVFLGMGMAQLVALPLGWLADALTMETLFPPMSWVVLAVLGGLLLLRPVILRARVPQHPAAQPAAQPDAMPQSLPTPQPAPAATGLGNGLSAPARPNGANGLGVSYIARVAPNKPGPA